MSIAPIPACVAEAIPTVPGTPFGGGFYMGRIIQEDRHFAMVTAPKLLGETRLAWHTDWRTTVPGARSLIDGYANTLAMAEAGSPLALWAIDLEIGGHKDWFIGARDQVELQFHNLKPGTDDNWLYGNRGANEHSVPPGKPYTKKTPKQTLAAAFRQGAPEAFERAWYWTSTEFGPGGAWVQGFGGGGQGTGVKVYFYRCRAVRKVLISN